jgi:carnosine N-methyltransferase
LYTLPHADLELLERLGYKQKLTDVDDAILANAEFLNQIVANPEIFGHDVSSLENEDEESLSGDLSGELDHPMESHIHSAGQ